MGILIAISQTHEKVVDAACPRCGTLSNRTVIYACDNCGTTFCITWNNAYVPRRRGGCAVRNGACPDCGQYGNCHELWRLVEVPDPEP
jgi:hypothetical protein